MFCKNCGSRLKDGAKFCGKCGTKVSLNNISINNQIGKNQDKDSFISDIMPVEAEVTSIPSNLNKSYNIDDFLQGLSKEPDIENKKGKTIKTKTKKTKVRKTNIKKSKSQKAKSIIKQNKAVLKNNKKKRTNSKAKSKFSIKSKKNIRTKSQNAIDSNKDKKQISKKLILIASAILVCIILTAAFFIIRSYSNNSKGNIAKAITRTITEIDKGLKKVDIISDSVINKEADENNNTEMFLKIDRASGGLINENILSSLEGISFLVKELRNNKKDTAYIDFTLANANKQDINASVYSNGNEIICSIPHIYDKSFGLSLIESDTTFNFTESYTKTKDITETVLDLRRSFFLAKEALRNNTIQLITTTSKNAKFEIEYDNKESEEIKYTGEIQSEIFTNDLITYIEAISNDESLLSSAGYILYTSGIHKNLINGQLDYQKQLAKIKTALQESLKDEKRSNCKVSITIKEGLVKTAEIKYSIGGIDLETNLTINKTGQKINFIAEVKMLRDDRKIDLVIDSKIIEDQKNSGVESSYRFSVGDLGHVLINNKKSYNIDKKNYTSELDFEYRTQEDKCTISFDLDGEIKTDIESKNDGKNGEMIVIDSLLTKIETSFYNVYIDFSGYIKNSTYALENSNINNDNVVYVDRFSEDESKLFINEIKNNFEKFINDFENYRW